MCTPARCIAATCASRFCEHRAPDRIGARRNAVGHREDARRRSRAPPSAGSARASRPAARASASAPTSTCAVNVGVTHVPLRTNFAYSGARSSDEHRPNAPCTGEPRLQRDGIRGRARRRNGEQVLDAASGRSRTPPPTPTTRGTWPANAMPRSRARRAMAKYDAGVELPVHLDEVHAQRDERVHAGARFLRRCARAGAGWERRRPRGTDPTRRCAVPRARPRRSRARHVVSVSHRRPCRARR